MCRGVLCAPVCVLPAHSDLPTCSLPLFRSDTPGRSHLTGGVKMPISFSRSGVPANRSFCLQKAGQAGFRLPRACHSSLLFPVSTFLPAGRIPSFLQAPLYRILKCRILKKTAATQRPPHRLLRQPPLRPQARSQTSPLLHALRSPLRPDRPVFRRGPVTRPKTCPSLPARPSQGACLRTVERPRHGQQPRK